MNQQLLERVLRSPRLPSLPAIALEVIDLVQDDSVSIKEIAETIQNDPAMSGKILKTVNSSFYGQSKSISTISQALVVLGLNSVKTLALGFTLVPNLKDAGASGFDHFRFWRHSLYAATAARCLAKTARLQVTEEAFLGGLLQDLGMLAMSQTLVKEYPPVLAAAGEDHAKLLNVEREMLDTDHAAVGAAVADAWKLPKQLVAPIQYHETPSSAPSDMIDLVRCVVLGNRVADLFMSEEAEASGQALDGFYRTAEKWFKVTQADAEPLLHQIHVQTKDMRRLFDLPTGGLGNADEILGQANEALMNVTLQAQLQTTELEKKNQELSDQAFTDSLTGVANRRKYNDFIAEQFDVATNTGRPLSIIFLDADHFKKFNDTYGHACGDRVLIQLGIALNDVTPEGGLVARYGGEEFSIVLPNTDRRAAAGIAEQARQHIAVQEVESDDGEKLNITASIGVATYDGTFFKSAEQLVKAADMGVYAAKNAGRNGVRIFTPRAKAA